MDRKTPDGANEAHVVREWNGVTTARSAEKSSIQHIFAQRNIGDGKIPISAKNSDDAMGKECCGDVLMENEMAHAT